MDEYAVAALCAVPPDLQGGDAEKFFDLIVEMYRDGGGPSSLDDLIPQITERESGLASPAAQFSENLRTQGLDQRWSDIAGTLASEGGSGSALASLRDQYAAQAGAAGAAGEAPSWEGFRAQNADFWSGWTGSDWAAWRAAFAERVPAELTAEIAPHLAYLDGLDPAGQLSYLRDSLGFAVNQEALDYYQSAGAAEPTAQGAGEAPTWEGFRAQNADFWSGWTGSDWAAWRAAFADRVPAELTAEVGPHLTYLDGLDPAGQLSYLRDALGFTISQEALDYYQAEQAGDAGPGPRPGAGDGDADAGVEAAGETETTPEAAAEQAAAEQAAAEQAAAEQVAAEQAAAAGDMAAEDAAMTQAVEEAEQAVETLLAASADVLSAADAPLVTHDVAAQAIDQVPGAESLSPEEIAEVMREVSAAIPG
jgi:hypothetical protein